MGQLAGITKVETACPVPSRLCKAWKPFPHARFTLTRLNAAGVPVRNTKRILRSDAAARFHLWLSAGYYLVRPTRGEIAKSRRVHVRRGGARTITLLFRAPLQRH